jgi:hypothetical protein
VNKAPFNKIHHNSSRIPPIFAGEPTCRSGSRYRPASKVTSLGPVAGNWVRFAFAPLKPVGAANWVRFPKSAGAPRFTVHFPVINRIGENLALFGIIPQYI